MEKERILQRFKFDTQGQPTPLHTTRGPFHGYGFFVEHGCEYIVSFDAVEWIVTPTDPVKVVVRSEKR
jgi:hypothetical protein